MTTWLRHWTQPADPLVRVLCLPPAGGGAHSFRMWAQHCPPAVGVVAVELPGHGARLGDPPAASLAELTGGELLDQVLGLLDRPLVVFGHSLGALIGLELCRAVRGRRPGWRPALLVAAGCAAPLEWQVPANAAGLSDAEVVRFLRSHGGTSTALLDNDEYLALLVPVVRAELAMIADRPTNPEPPLAAPVRAYLGQHDPGVSEATAAGWAAESGGDFRIRTLPGGHFFVQERPADVVDRLAADIEDVVGELSPPQQATTRG